MKTKHYSKEFRLKDEGMWERITGPLPCGRGYTITPAAQAF